VKIKNFIRHPRGGQGRKEIEQTVGDIERQITYLRSIGYADTDSEEMAYWHSQLEWNKKRLARLAKR
jgi:hypothetical protein